jgi:hypothetical protein
MRDEARTLLEAAFRRLVEQIAAGDYRDPLKQRLTQHPAYLDAVAVLELNDLLSPTPSPTGTEGGAEPVP